MSMQTPSDDDLHAYIDGALDSAARAAFEARLNADPELAARVTRFRADRVRLRTLFAPLAERPVPQAWLDLAHGKVKHPRLAWRQYAALAAALFVALGLGIAYLRHEGAGPKTIVEAALAMRDAAAGRVVAVVGNEPHRYDEVLADAVALHVRVPDMRRLGYRLELIHLYGAGTRGAAQLTYRSQDGRSVTLYVRRSDGQVHFDQFRRGALRVCVWQDDQIGMVIVGDVSTAAMQRLASMAYTGLIS